MVQDDLSRGGTVSQLRPRDDPRFPAISLVRAYWEALRNGRDMPFRSEIDPRGIESALEHTFILERIAPRLARFRLAGSHLSDLMGMEVRGMPFTAFFTTAARGETEAILARVFDGPETADLTLAPEQGTGRDAMDARLLLLPLRSDLGDVSRALGCLVGLGHTGRVPRRFDIAGARLAPAGGAARPHRPGMAPGAAGQRGFAEAPAAFAPSMARNGAKGQQRLRLVVINTDQ